MDEHNAEGPAELLEQGANVYRRKNEDYGDSWRTVGHMMKMMAGGEPVTLETTEDFIKIGLYTRRLDKLMRSFHAEFIADDLNFESVQDSHQDEGVYAMMHASLTMEEEL